MAIVVLIGAAAGAKVNADTAQASNRLLDHTQPARWQAYQLQAALLDQETGIRGYAITGDPQFLEPYNRGRRAQALAADNIRALVPERHALLADLDVVQTAAERWHTTYARPDAAPAVLAATSARGKALFDELRVTFQAQDVGLAAAIAADRTVLSGARLLRNLVLGGMVVVFLLTGLVLSVLVRRLIARPLRALTSASLRVADGDFDRRIDVAGPADIATVADAVESMRQRVVEELTTAREQETILARQKADLAVQTEELRRSNTELEQFAYVASHDLQEPLRKVASFCQLLDKRYGDQLDSRGKQYIDYAVDGAKRMQILINDLLAFSRVGRTTEQIDRVALDTALADALTNLSSVVDDAEARVELPAQLPDVLGDGSLLTMLWQNLIANAIKFRTPDLAPVVRVDAELDPETGMWEFAVTDNGIGIAPEFAEQVFVIFQRLHNRDEYDGTGIGLAISRKIVEYHGGKIWVDTGHTVGTRFCFTLPAPVDDIDHVIAADPAEQGALL
ncbi:CHASE3 domain-containing protein [Nocardia salmonicida]|uniref:sensor histidine kinase n=1 Tax=Nocardia salmonicida TaxID=53431 RepID=UPI00365D6C7B